MAIRSGHGPISEHLSVGGKFYFFEDDGIHGRELWRSDGTALGHLSDSRPLSGLLRHPLSLVELDGGARR